MDFSYKQLNYMSEDIKNQLSELESQLKELENKKVSQDSLKEEITKEIAQAISGLSVNWTPQKNSIWERTWEGIKDVASFFANLLVIGGIIIALCQYEQAENLDKKQVAIEAVNKLHEPEFLDALTRLNTVKKYLGNYSDTIVLKSEYKNEGFIQNKNAMIDDGYFISRTYQNIYMIWENKLGDKNIIEKSLCPEVATFDTIISKLINLRQFEMDSVHMKQIRRLSKLCKEVN